MNRQYEIPEYNWRWVQAQVEKLNRRAAKLGCKPVAVTHIDTKVVAERTEWTGTPLRYVKKYVVQVTGEAPKYAGWSFIATIQHTNAGNIIRSVPDEELPEQFRTKPTWCDHCQTHRIRNDTFVVRHEDGQYKQVGRQCVRDFLGHKSPQQLVQFAQWLANFSDTLESEDERQPGTRRAAFTFDTIEFLSWVSYWMRMSGWVSRQTAYDHPDRRATADIAIVMLEPTREGNDLRRENRLTTADRKRARQAMDWCLNELATSDKLNEYQYNLVTACKSEYGIEYRNHGLVASLIRTWDRAMDRIRERKAQQERKPSNYVGTKGERITVKITVLSVKEIVGGYGVIHLHRMTDDTGNIFIWFANTTPLTVGETYHLKGTIKVHEEYEGTKQTVLQRCKVVAS